MNTYLKLLVIGLCSILITQSAIGQSLASEDEALLALKADTLLQDAITFSEHVGLTAGVYANSKIVYQGGAGYRDKDNELPAEANMIHRIASIAKPMTAIAVMQLVEQGKIDLDVPIQTYVPEFPKKREGTITVRHLLTQTSGINAYKNGKDGSTTKEYATLLDAMDRFKDRKLVGQPGKVYQYTTYGYVVLGVIIEKVSGLSYSAYMQQYVWSPAGMQNTSIEKYNAVVENKSKFYSRNKKEKIKEQKSTNLSMKVPGGGLQSTVADLLRFGEAILTHKLIQKETFELMLENPGVRPAEAGNPYGMGWFLYDTDPARRVIGHSGGQVGTSTQFMLLPDQGVVVVGLSNTVAEDNWGNVMRLTWQLIDYTQQKETLLKPIFKKASSWRVQDINELLGTYDFGKKNKLKIYRKGRQLYSEFNKGPRRKLFIANKSRLFYRSVNAWFDFELDSEGRVLKTIYNQGDQQFFPEKIK